MVMPAAHHACRCCYQAHPQALAARGLRRHTGLAFHTACLRCRIAALVGANDANAFLHRHFDSLLTEMVSLHDWLLVPTFYYTTSVSSDSWPLSLSSRD